MTVAPRGGQRVPIFGRQPAFAYSGANSRAMVLSQRRLFADTIPITTATNHLSSQLLLESCGRIK